MDILSLSLFSPAIVVGGLGLLFGAGLAFAYKFLKVEDDPITAAIREALPGANCGACAFTGCDLFAEAVAKKQAKPNACPVGGTATVEEVSAIIGVEPELREREVAFIKCAGNFNVVRFQYKYSGLISCDAVSQLAGEGERACPFGCLGYRSCQDVCTFGAIEMVNGVAEIDIDKCTACGLCIKSCPKHLIEMQPYSGSSAVACNSIHFGKQVREYCSVGCIACNLCVKTCEYGAIRLENRLAIIDPEKCVACNKCVHICPMKTIVPA